MASAAVRRRCKRPRKAPNLVVFERGRELGQDEGSAWLVQVSDRLRQNREREDQIRILSRRPTEGNSSVRFAIRAVEQRIVKGLWVLELALQADGPMRSSRNGIGYIPDAIDHWGEAVAKGGWQPPAMRPAVPSSREIDAANEAKHWIEWLEDDQARLLTVAAMTKRGDRIRRIKWDRVKDRLRIPETTPLRTLQDRYDRALRTIVAELTFARIAA